MSEGPLIDIRDAVVLLGRFPALAGATLSVDRGDSVLLRGPNGAGKSTLLRLCAGLLRPARGVARVLGVDLRSNRRGVRHRVGYVGHQSMLYDDLTVAENFRFWSKAAGVEERQQYAAAERLEIDSRLYDVPVRSLSAGQRRRTSIAVAAARRPELWLLDEPHAGLDQDGRQVIDDLITDASNAGGAVLVASHELDRAESVVARTLEISGGLATEVGGADAE